MRVFLYQFYHGMSEFDFEIQIGDVKESKIELVLDFSIEEKTNKTYIPLTFVRNNASYVKK